MSNSILRGGKGVAKAGSGNHVGRRAGPRFMPWDEYKKYTIIKTVKNPPPPKCPSCGSYLEKRKGPYSEFWGCHEYPNCKFIKKYAEEKAK